MAKSISSLLLDGWRAGEDYLIRTEEQKGKKPQL